MPRFSLAKSILVWVDHGSFSLYSLDTVGKQEAIKQKILVVAQSNQLEIDEAADLKTICKQVRNQAVDVESFEYIDILKPN
jgi:hypothetical protein